jgi:hypothetical protein
MRSRTEKNSRSSRARSSTPTGRLTSPWLVFLQGGPGFPGPRPYTRSGWVKRALQDYRVLLLDSRGNGGSTVVLPRRSRGAATPGPRRAISVTSAPTASSTIASSSAAAGGTGCHVERSRPELWRILRVHYLSAHPEGLREVSSPEGCRLSRAARTITTARPTRGAEQDAEALRPLSPATKRSPRGSCSTSTSAKWTLPTGGSSPSAVSSSWDSAGIRRRHGDAPLSARIGLLRGSERRGA